MLLVTIGGIFIFSALIGVLNSGLGARLEQLRKGRSTVLEHDHTIIFNWSPSIFDVIQDLVIANESRRRPRIVIMAERDKVEMEDEIASKIPDLKNTRIICRSGEPTALFDIGIVNPNDARSIIILSPDGDEPDSQVIETILALVNGPDRRAAPFNIANEIRDLASVEVARVVGGNEVQPILADDLIARVVVQSTRQPGLAAVFTELLDFEGCEIYVSDQPALVGKTFGDAVMSFHGSSMIGLCDKKRAISLNLPADSVIPEGAKAIVIAEDDELISVTPAPLSKAALARVVSPTERAAERTLLIGWNRRAPIIAHELSRYVGAGSVLTIAADIPELDELIVSAAPGTDVLRIETRRIESSRQADIVALDPTSYDHIIVLGCSDHMSAQAADTRTLVTLLHLRRIADQVGAQIDVVSEMIDVRNRELARVTRVEDFVVSNRLVSLMLARASENPYLEAIFNDLLDEEGSEISLRPAYNHVEIGAPTTFYDLVEYVLRRGEIAIGQHRPSLTDDSGRGLSGVVINLTRSSVTFYHADDRVIILART
jgi:voltage-gated potassium channel Kch